MMSWKRDAATTWYVNGAEQRWTMHGGLALARRMTALRGAYLRVLAVTALALLALGGLALAQETSARTASDCDGTTSARSASSDARGDCASYAQGIDAQCMTAQGASGRQGSSGADDALSLPQLGTNARRGDQESARKAMQEMPDEQRAAEVRRQRPAAKSEFEVLVEKVTGRALPIYGQSLFTQRPSTFAPLAQAPVTADYVVGPGDELQVRIWGQLNADLRVTVDRAGEIYIPKVGEVKVAGVRASQLDSKLRDEVGRLYRNFSLTANLGRIRSIQIFVVGQAREPGSYTVSSLSTLVNAIFASGGPTAAGSLRDIQVQREGKTVAHLDLYALLVKGDKSGDVRLEPGDVLYYPPVGALAAVTGSVKSAAIYEVKAGERLEDLLYDAGGLATTADAERVTVERLLGRERVTGQETRSTLEFPLDAEARGLRVEDGDIVHVLGAVPRLEQTVTLRGSVAHPGNVPWRKGMRVRDLIPDAQALLTGEYWMRRVTAANAKLVMSVEKLSDEKAAERTAVVREPEEKRAIRDGANGRQLSEELHRTTPEINWSYAIIQRVNPVDLTSRLVPFDLGRAVLAGDEANNLALEPGDIVTVFSQADVMVPVQERTRYVRVEGEVVRPGVYQVAEGEGLREVLQRAGGLTAKAYVYGTQLTRESARREQQRSLDELAHSLEAELRRAAASAGSHAGEDAQLVRERQSAQENLIAQLRATVASGRVVLNLPASADGLEAYPQLEMEDNDRVVVPVRPSTVSVMGMVYNAGSFVYGPRHTVGDYLKLAGQGRATADMKHAFVLHADGSVTARTAVNGAFSGDRFSSLRMRPGDQIVVPGKMQSSGLMRGLRDWTQVTAQLALTGAAVAVIR